MDLSIIIVNWNSQTILRNCLKSLYEQCSGFSFEVIVVDNASYDGCSEMLRGEFTQVVFIQSDSNLGFARANNLGSRRARGENILFLNPDTLFIENSAAVLLRQLTSLPRAGAVGCKLLNSDRNLQTSCIQSFPTICNQFLDSDFLRGLFPKSRLWGTKEFLMPGASPSVVEAVSGACLMVKSEVFRKVGGFTEDYFMYGEDLYFCYKITRSGCDVGYIPETTLIHYGGGSSQTAGSNFSNVMMRASVYRFLRLNRGRISAAFYRAAMAINSIFRLLCIPFLMLVTKGRIVRHGMGSIRKWTAILRWSLGFEKWAEAYGQQPAPVTCRRQGQSFV